MNCGDQNRGLESKAEVLPSCGDKSVCFVDLVHSLAELPFFFTFSVSVELKETNRRGAELLSGRASVH